MSTRNFSEVTLYLGYALLGISLLIGCLRFRRLSNDQFTLWLLVVFAAVTELISRVLWSFKVSNLFLYHIYCVAEFSLLIILYRRNLKGLIHPHFFTSLIAAFILFAVVNTLFFQNLRQFNSNVMFVECLVLIILSILYFFKELRDLEHRNLEKVPMFWINASVITYFSGTLVLFYAVNDLIPVPLKDQGIVWGVHALFNIFHYGLYSVALGIKGKTESRNDSYEFNR